MVIIDTNNNHYSIFLSNYFIKMVSMLHLYISLFEIVPSGFPQAFVDNIISPQSVTFSWLPPLDYEQNGFIVTYTIAVIETRSGHMIQRTISSSLNSITISSLRPFTSYSCSIAASTSVGMGPFSTSLTILTLQDGKGCH